MGSISFFSRRLVANRLLLEEDIETCIDLAAERYDACMR